MEKVNVITEMTKEAVIDQAKAEAIARFTGENALPAGCEVNFIFNLPYAGGEAIVVPVIRHPIDEAFAALPA